MTNSYLYSIKVNEALERYGAKTHGSLVRRVERLKRFTAITNHKYAEDIRLENIRMMANQEREERINNRVREHAPVFLKRNLRRNLAPEFENTSGWYAMGSPNYMKNTNIAKMKKEAYLAEPSQEVEIPTTSHSYNLRSRSGELPMDRMDNGLNLLWRAIQNGFVNTNRG